jgi:hypothetical protein
MPILAPVVSPEGAGVLEGETIAGVWVVAVAAEDVVTGPCAPLDTADEVGTAAGGEYGVVLL